MDKFVSKIPLSQLQKDFGTTFPNPPPSSRAVAKGINHVALVCSDMAQTVRFYTGVLGMRVVKTIALPDGGQHFFFDCGDKVCV